MLGMTTTFSRVTRMHDAPGADGRRASELSHPEVAAELREIGPVWYHTMELAPGLVTEGEFDLREIPPLLPWIDVTGLRCLDVGTYDGFWAFEMERRGASEVVAIDVDDPWDYDWPEVLSPQIHGQLPEPYTDGPTGQRFDLARRSLGSSVQRHGCSIYDVDSTGLGTFDLVLCSSLLLHLRDPLRALAALRRVCRGHFLTNEPIDLVQSILNPTTPVTRFDGTSRLLQWSVPNATAQRRMLTSAGFEIERVARPVVMPFRTPRPRATVRRRIGDRAKSLVAGTSRQGVLQRPILARPGL